MNVGVILYSLRPAFLGGRIELNEDRLRALDSAVDLAAVTAALAALDTECRRGRPAGESRGARFRWPTATRSTIVPPRPVGGGLTAGPGAALGRLLQARVRLGAGETGLRDTPSPPGS